MEWQRYMECDRIDRKDLIVNGIGNTVLCG